jgi:hypothetical protein
LKGDDGALGSGIGIGVLWHWVWAFLGYDGVFGFGRFGITTFTTILYILPRRDVLGNFWSLGMGLAWDGILAFPWESADVHFVCCCLIGREGEMDHGVYNTMDCLLWMLLERFLFSICIELVVSCD